MNKEHFKFENAIKAIESPDIPTAQQFENGPQIDPLKRILTYESGEWESFIDEWVHSLTDQYMSIVRPTGAGDKGIDLAGFTDHNQLIGIWDNYQCKAYHPAPLSFGDVAPEIGKILWHSYDGVYAPPRACRFIASKGASTQLTLLISNKPELKKKIIEKWDTKFANKISTNAPISLEGDFKKYVEEFDFTIFDAPHPRVVIEQHKKTTFYVMRFGGGLPARPQAEIPPSEISPSELTYTTKLLEAYGDHLAKQVNCEDDLRNSQPIKRHFSRSREAFYHAESLRVFVRDKTEPGTFESLQDEIYDGVIDTCESDHTDGFERVKAVTGQAQTLSLDAHPLNRSAFPSDRRGICHQLANNDRLTWKK